MQLQIRYCQRRVGLDETSRFSVIAGQHAFARAHVLEHLARQAHRAFQRHAHQISAVDFVAKNKVRVVLQVLADPGQVVHHGDALCLQLRGRPHARDHQQLWRIESPRTQQHFFSGTHFVLNPVLQILNAHCTPTFKDNALDQHTGVDL